jgi:hypothetical protein
VREIDEQLSEVAEALEQKPIIMGHSFGAFAQLLLDAGLGAAGVSIDGAGVKGIEAMPLSEIEATFQVLHDPANKNKAVPITEKDFHYALTNNLSDEESRVVYDATQFRRPAACCSRQGSRTSPRATSTRHDHATRCRLACEPFPAACTYLSVRRMRWTTSAFDAAAGPSAGSAPVGPVVLRLELRAALRSSRARSRLRTQAKGLVFERRKGVGSCAPMTLLAAPCWATQGSTRPTRDSTSASPSEPVRPALG